MTLDIRDARFYVVVENSGIGLADVNPVRFQDAFDRATGLAKAGKSIKVLYIREATQMEITRFASRGLPTALVSEG